MPALPTLPPLDCRGLLLTADQPRIMGILNVTPDSFYDGGRFHSPEKALAQAETMVLEGADILDIGGQSTRPGHTEISDDEEIARVVPIIAALAQKLTVPLSIDTYKPAVARAALEAGAHVLNDIYGLQLHPEMANLASEFKCPVIAMHNEPGFQETTRDSIAAMLDFFRVTLDIADTAGIPRSQVVLDPGIGFAKTQPQNVEILARLSELHALGCPILLGASRKSVIGHVLGLTPEQRLEGTLTTTALGVWQGVQFFRVHDVRANRRTASMAHALRLNAKA